MTVISLISGNVFIESLLLGRHFWKRPSGAEHGQIFLSISSIYDLCCCYRIAAVASLSHFHRKTNLSRNQRHVVPSVCWLLFLKTERKRKTKPNKTNNNSHRKRRKWHAIGRMSPSRIWPITIFSLENRAPIELQCPVHSICLIGWYQKKKKKIERKKKREKERKGGKRRNKKERKKEKQYDRIAKN